ncbi:HCP-like protein [Mytilinidion resinicola]|uniref:HCP-like protein n=1 Tax=Mytilinidion resinicola TaxID=574789 RepID=A0A6A6YJP7_9PEZI|nr:HCP-like protein [Mytilinidion resinicola]KAF2808184.1 HCP-like protein [Mytilinidion resinicola]
MRLQSPRRVPLLLFALFLYLALASAQYRSHDQAHAKQQPLGQRASSLHHWGKSQHHDEVRGAVGAHAVEEATSILRKIRSSTSRLSRLSRPTGILGTATYYAKELFFLLFMNGPPQQDLVTSKPQGKRLGQPLAQAVILLEEAAAEQNPDALFLLAEMNFYGNFTYPRNYSEAFARYHALATLNGNSSAQNMVGFMYATGIGSAVKQDQAKALLYHTLAAESGDIRSEMTVAYRHHIGIATPRNCEEAVFYYKKVADKAITHMRSGPPGGFSMIKESYRIADEVGGVYGEGASASSSGQYAKLGGPSSDVHASVDDVLEYLDLMARKGDPKATYNLARLHYDGSRAFKRDFGQAKKRFLELARMYWTRDGRTKSDVPGHTEKLASKAAGYLGRMFLRGEGIDQSFSIAQTWFKRGISNGDSLSQYSMGLMYLNGLGVSKDPVKAADYFAAAADQDLAVAQVRLGALFLDQGDIPVAIKYFELAARNGHIEAFYYLAELSHQGVEREKSCGVAVAYYKIVAEKAEIILSSFQEANEAYDDGDLETALVDYMMAAEQGFEIGQANVAYLLDQSKPKFTVQFASFIPFIRRKASLVSDAALALIYWTRSAKQQNIDSMVKMGDYYLEGMGTPLDHEKAAACYLAAAETLQSAQAMWNLGWMHENGIGIEQDFHLAKRFYDQALETNPKEAYLPVLLSLYKLRLRSWWNTVTNGRVNSIQDEPVPQKEWSLSEFINNFLEADATAWDTMERDDYDASHDPMPGGDDDYYEDIESDLIESAIILALTAALAFLVYYRAQRQRRAEARRQQQQQAQEQGDHARQEQVNDQGVFPQRNDPEFLNWAAGGVGH